MGSASLISDYKGDEYQRIEYTPYGETWVEKTSNTGLEFLPYKFTAKELDKETGLYYYGARYLDPKYSRWISTDPALGEYLTDSGKSSSGGIYNDKNLNLYHYANNNPIKYTDPDGRDAYLIIWATYSGNIGHAGFAIDNYDDEGKPDKTVTYYDLWPGNSDGVGTSNVSDDVNSYYGNFLCSLDDLINGKENVGEDYAPDGAIRFATTKEIDDATKDKFSSFMEKKIYNGEKRNCSDMAKVGVNNSGKGGKKKDKVGQESFFGRSFTTPNRLFKDSKKMNNASIIKDPGKKVNGSFAKEQIIPRIKSIIQEELNK